MSDAPSLPAKVCARCQATAARPLAWRCACGGPLEYAWRPTFNPDFIRTSIWSQWRYGNMLLPPGVPVSARATLGEGMSPLLTRLWDGVPVTFKLEFLMPTGSYKDRGSATLLSVLHAEGHRQVVEDSSGNAGASVAAYAAAAGIEATIYVPAHASVAKKEQIATFGAILEAIEGSRQATSEACHRAAQERIYASHAWHPAFLLGQMAAAWELWEQTGGQLPDLILTPLGQGGMLLGYYRGCKALRAAGLIERMPRLVGVQSAACAPIVAAWERGSDRVEPVEEYATIAEGIRIKSPARGEEILQALRESGGFPLAVEDDAVDEAQRALARAGLFVEATSAAAVAGLPTVRERFGADANVLVPLSGSGLKEMG